MTPFTRKIGSYRGLLTLSFGLHGSQRKNDLRIAANVFDTSAEAILITDAENKIIDVNAAFSYITGYSKENVLGKNPNILSSGKQEHTFYQALWSQLQLTGRWQGEVINKKKNGELYNEWLSIVVIKDAENNAVRHIAIFSDITKRKQAEVLIKQQATEDSLTGLPNRRLFDDRLKMSINLVQRDNKSLVVMFIDLDHFKTINDELGHAYGDDLLQQAAKRLQTCIRKSDTVARVGGDEFAVILQTATSKKAITEIAKKLLNEIQQPFDLNGTTAKLTASIGIAICPKNAKTHDALVNAADQAMYYIKEHGRNGYQFAD